MILEKLSQITKAGRKRLLHFFLQVLLLVQPVGIDILAGSGKIEEAEIISNIHLRIIAVLPEEAESAQFLNRLDAIKNKSLQGFSTTLFGPLFTRCCYIPIL